MPFQQELLDRQVETPFPQKILGFFRKQAHTMLCLASFTSKVNPLEK